MDEKVKSQLTKVVAILGIQADEFAKLRKTKFTAENLPLEKEIAKIESNVLNLHAMTEKLLRDLSAGIPQNERHPFLNPFVD